MKLKIQQRLEESKSCLEEIYGILEDIREDEFVDELTAKNFKLKRSITSLKELKVAAIMDQFTLESYRPECELIELTPDNWENELKEFSADLVFIESAWNGKDGLWYRKVDRNSKEIYELTEYCHKEDIPVVFWNKEDPIYTTSFMTTAALADFVFTTDIDCVQRYKTELGHNRVYHLHFAAQPTIHNPIEKYDRKDKFCFAGAYYHKYKKRAEVFDEFSDVFISSKGFDIFDRNYGNARPEHAFPERYNPYILGKLASSEIDVAYKGYTYGINMNSVQQSQSMFARRVFEMLASNTITVGNYSRGLKNYFGDLTICTDDASTMKQSLDNYCATSEDMRKYRLLGLRKVLGEHLYEDRLDYIVNKVFGVSLKEKDPSILMVARCEDKEQLDYVIETYKKQTYSNKSLVVIGEYKDKAVNGLTYISEEEAKECLVTDMKADYLACISPTDYYGKFYLEDLVHTRRFGNYDAIGKGEYYSYSDNEFSKVGQESTYRKVDSLETQCSIVRATMVDEKTLWEASETERKIVGGALFSNDEFHYCKAFKGNHCECVDDIEVVDCGITLQQIEKCAERIKKINLRKNGIKRIPGATIASQVKSSKHVSYIGEGKNLRIRADLEEGQHEYAWMQQRFEIEEYVSNQKLKINFKVEGVLDCICVCMFYDENGEKLEPKYPRSNASVEIDVPDGARTLQIGFRPKGKGSCIVREIVMGGRIDLFNESGCFLSRSNVLVISNQYPAPEALYRNMFVHKRMCCYKDAGKVFDVMRINSKVLPEHREFEGINIIDGGAERLETILESGTIKTVCVHFLDALMWNVLKKYADKIRILVWCHGSEIQPWWRREYNYNSEEELAEAKVESDIRMKFWASVFSELDKYPNVHFILVSQYFANEIFEDNNIVLPKERYSIIHNCIDTEMFDYVPKSSEQRKKILSIRPFASNKYANDLTVKCIQELAKKDYFDELEIRLIGNGKLFEETLEPLKNYTNVITEKTFLRQDEIAKMHKEYGIFMVPTRMDAQGVSRDEAMSSGLVPVTNAVTAIPEFVDESCGILADGEDYRGMADGVDKLYHNPELFVEMSQKAADRVRNQTSKEYTIDAEIRLICR